MLKGEKVILRPINKTDLPIFLKWYNDEEVIEFLSMYTPITDMMEEKWLEEALAAKDRIHFMIEAVEGDKTTPIGSIGLNKLDHRCQSAEMGIAIGAKDYWGKGYGGEAVKTIIDYGFKQLNLRRISSYVFSPNGRSLRMHQKLGFVKEGVLRQAFYKNGRFMDEVLFGMLREEWEKK